MIIQSYIARNVDIIHIFQLAENIITRGVYYIQFKSKDVSNGVHKLHRCNKDYVTLVQVPTTVKMLQTLRVAIYDVDYQRDVFV